MTEASGYKYAGEGGVIGKISREQRAAAETLSDEIHSPSLSNVDFLVQSERTTIISRWTNALPDVPMAILDVGGRLQPYRTLFKSKCETYVATDLQCEGLVDVLATAETLPFKDNSFNLVLCTQVMSYVSNPQAVIDEFHRVLLPAGMVIITAPSLFPEHHDEIWRFLPAAYRHLMRDFETVDIEPEGNSIRGLIRTLNVFLHAEIESYRLRWLAEKTTIPLINLLGIALSPIGGSNTRCTANYCVFAQKAR